MNHREPFRIFDPEQGSTIIDPPGVGQGWWAGAPGGFVDSSSGEIYLTYRLRRPRGVTPDRGGVCLLAKSVDGLRFETIWQMEKADLASPSLERSALTRLPDGTWVLYISYVDGRTNQWRTDLIHADEPRHFNPADRRKLFLADEIGLAAVKDPVLVRTGTDFTLLLSCAAPRSAGLTVRHDTADAYDTGTILSHTGLASSADGLNFNWEGLVLRAEDDGGWDGYSARIATVLTAGDRWVALYDGAFGVENHYDETTGLATSADLRTWTRLTPEGPALTAPGGRCLRYVEALRRGEDLFFYYEYGRPDGSHELRMSRVPARDVLERFTSPA